MILNDLQVKVVNNFLNILIIELANSYLNKLKKFKTGEVEEIVLKFLDNSVYLAVSGIDITNYKHNENIQRMSSQEIKKFKKATAKVTVYSSMFKTLNYIYAVIKEETEQQNLFDKLYNWYDLNENRVLEEEIDIYKAIKPELLNSSNIYKGKLSVRNN